MKKALLTLIACTVAVTLSAQWTTSGTTLSTSQNVGIGTNNPAYKLDVNGNARAKALYLDNVESNYARIYYPGLSLMIGSLNESALDCAFDIRPGAVASGTRQSIITMWQANAGNSFEKKIQLRANGITYFNGGNVGIGTDNPGYQLDVAGDFRASNIVLQNGSRISTKLYDNFTYDSKSMGHYAFLWSGDSWSTSGSTLWQSGYGGIKFFTGGQYRVGINNLGNVRIGTDNPQNKLDVVGTIRATEVKVETGWADFVFADDYKLPTLKEVEAHISEHRHLPGIPSEAEVKENGVSLGEMQAKLLQKIKELTLYVIKQDKTIKEQGELIQELKSKLE